MQIMKNTSKIHLSFFLFDSRGAENRSADSKNKKMRVWNSLIKLTLRMNYIRSLTKR